MTAQDEPSVAFDRAAAYYDQTRGIPEEAMAANLDVLADELEGRGRLLEVGVGTGLLALPLRARGLPVAGVDLSAPMLAELMRKAGDTSSVPVTLADATRLPFPDHVFGGAYLRWVLHLIPAWETALAEMVRVVDEDGVLCVNLGAYGGLRGEIQDRFSEITGIDHAPVGLGWGASEELDRAMDSLGRRYRPLPPIHDTAVENLGEFLVGIQENRYSWTWRLPEDVRMAGLEALRPWALERFGALDTHHTYELTTQWRAYDPIRVA